MDFFNEIIKFLSLELDYITIRIAKRFIELELSSDSFLSELENYVNIIMKSDEKDFSEEYLNRNKKVIMSIMLGMGRNRTIEFLKEDKVDRRIFEKIRDTININNDKRKKDNDKKITALKSDSSARKKRQAELGKVNWELIKEEYIKGESPINLGKKYNVSAHYITLQLIDEDIFDETRSTLTKKKIASESINQVDNDYIVNLVNNNPLDSKDLLWSKAKDKYPWILRHQFYTLIDELNLTRTSDEVNAIRSIKSKVESNGDYMIKLNGYKAAKEIYGSIDNLVKLYMENSLGSFNKIADKINENIKFDYEISPKQVSKIITNHSTYRREKSLGQQQLYKFIKETFKDYQVYEEYSWDGSSKQIDVFISELNIGFEFNGEYWHSDTVINYNYGKSAYEFHNERAQAVKKHGIKLLYVWENDWSFNYKDVENAIQSKSWDSPILNKYENIIERSGSYVAPNKKPSLLRKQVIRFLKEKKIKYKKENNSHLIKLEDFNIVINIPNYNSLSNKKETLNLQKDYESKGVELLTFLPWRNIFKIKEFLTYRLQLSSIVKVPARKCVVVHNIGITKEQRNFFNENHLLGYSNFKKVEKTITLEYDGKTVIAASFVMKPNSSIVELDRLVSAYGVSVQGGASKLIKEYIRQNNSAEEIFTYSDSDLGFGGVYETIGFELVERSKEQLSWYNENLDMSFSNLSLIKQGSDRLLSNVPNYEAVGQGENLPSNQEIVKIYGFIPIYDSGYKKWRMKL